MIGPSTSYPCGTARQLQLMLSIAEVPCIHVIVRVGGTSIHETWNMSWKIVIILPLKVEYGIATTTRHRLSSICAHVTKDKVLVRCFFCQNYLCRFILVKYVNFTVRIWASNFNSFFGFFHLVVITVFCFLYLGEFIHLVESGPHIF